MPPIPRLLALKKQLNIFIIEQENIKSEVTYTKQCFAKLDQWNRLKEIPIT